MERKWGPTLGLRSESTPRRLALCGQVLGPEGCGGLSFFANQGLFLLDSSERKLLENDFLIDFCGAHLACCGLTAIK